MDLYTALGWSPANPAGLAALSQYQRLTEGKASAGVAEALPVVLPSTSHGCGYNNITQCGQ
jgi:hypothetical protein